jgi:hypothetical protein
MEYRLSVMNRSVRQNEPIYVREGFDFACQSAKKCNASIPLLELIKNVFKRKLKL